MPGLAAACGASGVPKGATYLYSLSWLVSTLVAGFVYWVSFKLVPFPVDEKQELVIEGGEVASSEDAQWADDKHKDAEACREVRV